jgi:hypothetical protein
MGKQLTINGLYGSYKDYKEQFFPRLLEDPTVPNEDKEKIKGIISKPFNPYIRRHSALTEKSSRLKSSTLEQHAGWVPGSNMQKRYVHYFGNESSISILEAYGIKTNDSIPINMLNPKICPNCNEGNTQDARFCSKCKMIMSFDGYQEALESQKQKEDELSTMKQQFNNMQSILEKLIISMANIQNPQQFGAMAQSLFSSGMLKIHEK